MTTRGRGRPAIGPALRIRFTAEQVERIDIIARIEDRPRAEIVRDLIDEALADRGGQ